MIARRGRQCRVDVYRTGSGIFSLLSYRVAISSGALREL